MRRGYEVPKRLEKLYSISERTVRRWAQHHREIETGLKPKRPDRNSHDERFLHLWNSGSFDSEISCMGSRRIKHSSTFPVLENGSSYPQKHGLLIRIKAKPQQAGKRFQRQHVDSMWQEILFNSESVALERSMSPDSLTIVPAIA